MRTLSLRTVGRKTGTPRGTPLYYVDDCPNMAIVTSNAGRDREPAWWLNLQARPDAEVEIRKETHRIRARPATPTENERLWPQFVAGLRFYETCRRRTDRELAIVILEPR